MPAIVISANATLEALASTRPERLAALGARFRIPKLYRSYEGLLGDSEIEAVYIPLPNALHREWSIAALSRGKHVLCEKPLALDAEQAREMADAAKGSGRLLMEAFMYRFNTNTVSFVESIQGKVVHVHAAFAAPQQDSNNIRLRRELGGGALMDLGCYAVNAARWLLGEPDRIWAVADEKEVDRNVAAVLSFPGGGSATLWASFDAPEYQELSVSTETATVRIGPVNGSLLGRRPFAAWADPAEKDGISPYRFMVEAFSKSVRKKKPAPLSVADSIANLTVLDEIRRVAGISFAGTPGARTVGARQ